MILDYKGFTVFTYQKSIAMVGISKFKKVNQELTGVKALMHGWLRNLSLLKMMARKDMFFKLGII